MTELLLPVVVLIAALTMTYFFCLRPNVHRPGVSPADTATNGG